MKKAKRKHNDGPSKASLREMPELDFKKMKVTRNPYAKRYAEEGVTVHVARGRPKRGTETGLTAPRSIRFPVNVWKHLEERAKRDGLPLHAALRAAVLAWAR